MNNYEIPIYTSDDFKGMRKAGADFFYDQQKKFKRIYDLVNDTKKN